MARHAVAHFTALPPIDLIHCIWTSPQRGFNYSPFFTRATFLKGPFCYFEYGEHKTRWNNSEAYRVGIADPNFELLIGRISSTLLILYG
jgi:hypothetical protein